MEGIAYKTPSQPRQLRIDSTTFCNATCLSCHRFHSKRQGTMSKEMILQILNDVARWEVPLTEIIPVNYGEFFSQSRWKWILKTISQKLPKTNIVIPTNGFYLEPEVVSELAQIHTVRLINFSINAYFPSTYEKFMSLPAENIKRIENAMKLLKVLRPDITRWASIVFDPAYQTDYERDMFISYWKQFAIPQIMPAASAGRIDKGVLIPNAIPCRSIFSDFVIGFDGKLSSCCFDSAFSMNLGYYSGDAKKDWHNPKLEELRKAHNEGCRRMYPLCARCTFA